MEPLMPTSPPPAVLETLKRLSSKSGVVAAIAIDRISSTILASTGNFTAVNGSQTAVSSLAATNTSNLTTFGSVNTTSASTSETVSSTIPNNAIPPPSSLGSASATRKSTDGISEFASRIWHYVNYSGQLVADMDSDDDLKLLRLRTKKHEFMIVPDPKYIFVVVHEVSA